MDDPDHAGTDHHDEHGRHDEQQQREDASLAVQAVPAEATAQKARAEAGQILTDSFLSQQELSGL